MAQAGLAIPTLPSRNLDETVAFYGVFGFESVFRTPEPGGYVILRLGGLELHFFHWPELNPGATYSGCYLRVSDVDAMYEQFAAARLPARGVPSLGGIEKKFYRMREFRLVDPSGNLVRVGEEMKRPRSVRA